MISWEEGCQGEKNSLKGAQAWAVQEEFLRGKKRVHVPVDH